MGGPNRKDPPDTPHRAMPAGRRRRGDGMRRREHRGQRRTLHSKLGLGISPQAVAKVAERYRRHRSRCRRGARCTAPGDRRGVHDVGTRFWTRSKSWSAAQTLVCASCWSAIRCSSVCRATTHPSTSRRSRSATTCILTTAHRQQGGRFLQILDRMREGYAQRTDVQWLKQQCRSTPDSNGTTLYPTNLLVKRHNSDAQDSWRRGHPIMWRFTPATRRLGCSTATARSALRSAARRHARDGHQEPAPMGTGQRLDRNG